MRGSSQSQKTQDSKNGPCISHVTFIFLLVQTFTWLPSSSHRYSLTDGDKRDMRLLTHNLLACHARSCTQTSNNFPLECRQIKLELQETEYNDAFLRGFLPKLDWSALVKTARDLGDTSLPDQSPDINDPMMDEDVLKKLHHVLLEVSFHRNLRSKCLMNLYLLKMHIIEGQLVCPNCSHIFPIRNGIPNMVSLIIPDLRLLPARSSLLTFHNSLFF